MLGVKTFIKKTIKNLTIPTYPPLVFPESGMSTFHIKAKLREIKNELKSRNIAHSFGWLYTLPDPITVWSNKFFIDQNPNHLGNWSIPQNKPWATQQLEYEVIGELIHLYHGSTSTLEGYVTSGGTESNIYATWVGKKYLKQFVDKREVCLVKTQLTHHSISKAADITDINEYLTPLDESKLSLNTEGLSQTINTLYTKGYRGFLIPLTLGYAQTGTRDDIESTTKMLQLLHHKKKDIFFYVWIDAALDGLILPFIHKKFTPFHSPYIQMFVTDFHKFGLAPYPAGIILYRKSLRNLIERSIDYLPEKDNTLLGSRPGTSSVNIWSAIHYFGWHGYKRLVSEQLQNKKYFIRRLLAVLPKTEIITNDDSITCLIVFHSFKNKRLPLHIEQKYGLYPLTTKLNTATITNRMTTRYKFYFLPHIKQNSIDDIIVDFAQNS